MKYITALYHNQTSNGSTLTTTTANYKIPTITTTTTTTTTKPTSYISMAEEIKIHTAIARNEVNSKVIMPDISYERASARQKLTICSTVRDRVVSYTASTFNHKNHLCLKR